MTPETQQALRESWDLLVPNADRFARQFYEKLFADCPDAAQLFVHTSMPEQRRKFLDMLTAVVHLLDRPTELMNAAKELGKRHAQYGVKDRHYADVGAALLSTIDDVLGEHSSVRILDAWREAYSLLASVMQQAARAKA